MVVHLLYYISRNSWGTFVPRSGKGPQKSPERGRGGTPPPLPSASRMLHAAEAAFSTQHDPQQGRDSTTLQDVTAATKPLDMMHSRL